MIDWLYSFDLWIATASGLFLVFWGLIGRKPSGLSILLIAAVQLMLVVQLLASIAVVIQGGRAKGDTLEFFGYLVVALLIPAAAAFWALIERTKWSTVILGFGSLTVAVMLVRMLQIWSGDPTL